MTLNWRHVAAGALLALAAISARSQEIVDQIAARVEGDIILLSEVRTLSRYQILVDGKAESDAAILDRRFDQWIVRNEAATARFPHPADVAIAHGLEQLGSWFACPEGCQARKQQPGLSDEESQRIARQQRH